MVHAEYETKENDIEKTNDSKIKLTDNEISMKNKNATLRSKNTELKVAFLFFIDISLSVNLILESLVFSISFSFVSYSACTIDF
jgi:hypothetical protein